MSSGRPQRTGVEFNNAEPDASLPPPPPYNPVDRTNTSSNQSQAQALAQQQASRQQYAPPPGPPPGAYPSSGGGAVRRASTIREDPLDFLKSFDTIFIIDDSGSMNINEQPDGSIGKSRWEEARDAVSGVVELAAKYDRDGVDVYFLNSERCIENCTDPQEVLRVFDSIEPDGATPTGMRLEIILLEYLDRIEDYKERVARGQNTGPEPKKRNIIILTDGSSTDDPESVIVACARRLDRANAPLAQIGVQIIQVGDDVEASEALQELDDALSKEHGIRDMVDTLTYSSMVLNADLIIKALLGGVNRRLDRKKDRNA